MSHETGEDVDDALPQDPVEGWHEHLYEVADAGAAYPDEEEDVVGPLLDHAERLLAGIVDRIFVWHQILADDLDGPDYVLARLQGLAGSLVSLLDCAGWDEDEVVDALYELNEDRDINELIKSYNERTY